MSKRRTYTIQSEIFPTKNALKKRIQEILYQYKIDQQLSNGDFLFMIEVLKNHPDYEIKNGVGINAIFVKQNPVYKQHRGFWVARLDGTETDFSYLECLKETTHKKKFINACRVAIEPYTQEYKRTFFNNLNGKVYFCPYTNEPLNFIGSHVHHEEPNTFQQLVKIFVTENMIEINNVEINSAAGDNLIQDTFKDKKLERLWIDFHNSHAKLQIISRKGNLSHSKK
ncbi:MAG: DCL family protein [Anaerolineales bacterium]|nr:DCL family protein [Anaerolineales bacterium]